MNLREMEKEIKNNFDKQLHKTPFNKMNWELVGTYENLLHHCNFNNNYNFKQDLFLLTVVYNDLIQNYKTYSNSQYKRLHYSELGKINLAKSKKELINILKNRASIINDLIDKYSTKNDNIPKIKIKGDDKMNLQQFNDYLNMITEKFLDIHEELNTSDVKFKIREKIAYKIEELLYEYELEIDDINKWIDSGYDLDSEMIITSTECPELYTINLCWHESLNSFISFLQYDLDYESIEMNVDSWDVPCLTYADLGAYQVEIMKFKNNISKFAKRLENYLDEIKFGIGE